MIRGKSRIKKQAARVENGARCEAGRRRRSLPSTDPLQLTCALPFYVDRHPFRGGQSAPTRAHVDGALEAIIRPPFFVRQTDSCTSIGILQRTFARLYWIGASHRQPASKIGLFPEAGCRVFKPRRRVVRLGRAAEAGERDVERFKPRTEPEDKPWYKSEASPRSFSLGAAWKCYDLATMTD